MKILNWKIEPKQYEIERWKCGQSYFWERFIPHDVDRNCNAIEYSQLIDMTKNVFVIERNLDSIED